MGGLLRTLIVNFKNYPEILGEGSVRLARAVEKVASMFDVEGIVSPPTPMLALVASNTEVQVYSQSVDSETGGMTTGRILPEAVKAAGALGTLLNHSESKRTSAELRNLVPRVVGVGMEVCLCAESTQEAVDLSALGTRYLAIEPPELIGSGVAVSRAKPELVERTVSAVKKAGYRGKVLCGAGIVSGEDVVRAVELGAEGILVASSVVKAPDWETKVTELAGSLK
jgi:triosephosphate isomerase